MKTESKGHNLTAEVNNFHVSYDDVGEGRIPIIFLHGFPFDKSMWRKQLEFLQASYRVIAYDSRGFGKSYDEESALSIDILAEDLIAFMDKLHLEKAIVCGFSMGGFITLNALKRFPQRFEALILCDTQCIADTAEVKAKRNAAIDDITANGALDFNEGFIKRVFHKDSLLNKKELVVKLRSVVYATSHHSLIRGLTALAERTETCSTLSAIHIPTMIICGREDEVTPLAQSESMHAAIKGSLLCIIENAGHVANVEQPDEFNNYLHEFLRSVSDR